MSATREAEVQAAGDPADTPKPELQPELQQPLSFAQQRLWFLEQLQPGTAVYNLPIAWRLSGALDVAAFERSVNEVIRRHAALRTVFRAVEGKAVQAVPPFAAAPVPVIDLGSAANPETEARRWIDRETLAPFDLERGPLFRACVLRLQATEHVALFNAHHIVWDGVSIELFRREVAELYSALRAGRDAALPELPMQYTDFTAWQREAAHGHAWDEQLNYWKEQLRGPLPVLELPADHARPATPSLRGATEFCRFDDAVVQSLRALGRQHGATLFMTLLAAFKALLHRYTGQEDILVGSPITGRDHADAANLIGFFVNTLALRTDVSGDPTFLELLQRVKRVTLDAYANQEMPFERIVQALQPERTSGGHAPFLQVVVGFESGGVREWPLGDLRASLWEIEATTAKFDWTFLLEETDAGLKGRLEYNTDLFEEGTIRRFLRHFQLLLAGIAADPARRVSEFPLLTDAERQQVLVDWNRTATDYERHACVHELFAAQAQKTPDAIALVFGEQEMSYAELNARSDRLADQLKQCGAGPGVLVGLCLERSLELIVAMLAILKAGGAYVPLDRSYPRERLQFMLQDTAAPVLVTDSKFDVNWSDNKLCVVCVDSVKDFEPKPATETGAAKIAGVTAESIAYVIYTSGSTGVPKGAAVPHRGIVRLVRNTHYVELSPRDVFLQLAPVSFDASTFEIWGCLLNGGRLVIFPPELPSLAELGRTIERHGVTVLWLTAGLFHQVIEQQPGSLQSVRQLLAGGDVLSVAHVLKAVRELPGCRLINGYGPTENTTFTCCHRVPAEWTGGRSVPIGRPISNTEVYVLDKNLAPVPVGVPGELYIGGDGLARGYWNRPELTAEKFVRNPWSADSHVRESENETGGQSYPRSVLYRTGDLVRWLPDGTLEFLRRLDAQLKIRGYRIEPGEIEAALAKHPAVREAAVIARDGQLVAFVVAQAFEPAGSSDFPVRCSDGRLESRPNPQAGKPALRESTLGEFLEQSLPPYLLPTRFVPLERLPLTPNGKVDRRALASVELAPAIADEAFAPPRNGVEQTLARIWSDVLGRAAPGIHDNFFQLGGHSLLATQIVSRVAREFQLELPVRAIFEAPTIAALGEKIGRASDAPKTARAGIARRLQRDDAKQLLERLDELSEAEVDALLRSTGQA